MKTKSLGIKVKADSKEIGVISGYASVFNNVDSYGDIVVPGSFADFLAKARGSGKVIPVFYGHNMEDPKANIGRTVELREDDHGLFFKAQLDLSGDTYGKVVYEQIKDGRLDSMSFGFSVLDSKMTDRGCELRELELYEISVVPIPANSSALITDVKAGRKISSKNMDRIWRAYEALGELLAECEELGLGDPEEDEKSKGVPMDEVMALLGVKENQ